MTLKVNLSSQGLSSEGCLSLDQISKILQLLGVSSSSSASASDCEQHLGNQNKELAMNVNEQEIIELAAEKLADRMQKGVSVKICSDAMVIILNN